MKGMITLICRNCGAEIDDNSVFCSKCGHKTDISIGNGINPNDKTVIHKKSNKKPIFLILISIAAFVSAAAVGISLFFNINGEEAYTVTTYTYANDEIAIDSEYELNIDVYQFADLSYEDIKDIFGDSIEEAFIPPDDKYCVYYNNGFDYKFTFKKDKVKELEISHFSMVYENDEAIFMALQIDERSKFDKVNDTGYAKKFVLNTESENESIKQILIQGIDENNHTAEKIRISYK